MNYDLNISRTIKKNYKIKNINYCNSYDLSLMDQKIRYELNTSIPVPNKFYNNLFLFLNELLFNRIDKLFIFLYYMDVKYISKIRYALTSYYKKTIESNKNKQDYIKYLSRLLFRNYNIYDFTRLFTKNEFILILKKYYKKMNL